MNRMLAIVFVLLGGASYGLISPIVKMAYDDGFTPADVTSSQYFMATVVLLAIAVFRLSHLRRLKRKSVLLLVSLGIISTGTSVFYYLSLSYLPASLAIVLLFQFTWVVMLIDYIVTRAKPTPAKWAALVMVVLGTLFAVDIFHAEWTDLSPVGLLLGFLSSLTYSAFLYLFGYVKTDVSPWVNSAIVSVAATISVFFIFPPKFLWNGTMGDGLWLWALLIGGLGQVIPPVFFNLGIPVVGGSLAGVLGSIELPVAVTAAFLLLREEVVGVQWVGIALILVGIIVSELRFRSRRQANA
jgi:drug/metabolite transporter (DMT)-like permease